MKPSAVPKPRRNPKKEVKTSLLDKLKKKAIIL